jgi:hypothetical protein
MAAETKTTNPAAGPETLMRLFEINPTKTPPIIPAIKPAAMGTLLANAIPKQSGKATKNTVMEDKKSLEFQNRFMKNVDYALKISTQRQNHANIIRESTEP